MKKKFNSIVIIDNNQDRRMKIKTMVESFAEVTNAFSQINGIEYIPDLYNYSSQDKKVCLNDAELLFIHINNSFSKPFIIDAIKNFSKILIIVYTGGGSDAFEDIPDEIKKCERVICKPGVTTNNAHFELNLTRALDFFSNNKTDFKSFINIIIKYNPKLNATLEFLHNSFGKENLDDIKKMKDAGIEGVDDIIEGLKDESDHIKKLSGLRDALLKKC